MTENNTNNAMTTFFHEGKEITVTFEDFCHFQHEIHFGCPDEASAIISNPKLNP